MNVVLDPKSKAAETATARPPGNRASAPQPAPSRAPQGARAVPAGEPQAAVTFRRDDRGQVYYVVTDLQTGKELQQIPAEQVRKVGEGIANFLKRLEGQSKSHVEAKA